MELKNLKKILDKKVQLNVNIDTELLKKLKILALEKNMKLGDLVNQLIFEKINNPMFKINKKSFSPKDSLNCTNFMRSIFEAKLKKEKYSNKEVAFEKLLSFIAKSSQWDKSYSHRLKTIILEDNYRPWTSEELNKLTKDRECECPIYEGLREWIGCNEFPSQDLICDLGASLIPIIFENI